MIGADVRTVERAMRVTDAGQFALFQGPFAGLLDLTAVMIEVAERADATLADVQQSAEAYAAFQRQLLPYKQALDLWVSQWFDEGRKTKGQHPAVEFMTMHSGDVLPALRGEIVVGERYQGCLLYTSDAADERSSVDLGGRRIIKKNKSISDRQKSTHKQVYKIDKNKMS